MAAQREGERFPIADAHNDALLGLRAEDPVPRGQINLEGLDRGGASLVCFAAFVGARERYAHSRLQEVLVLVDRFYAMVEACGFQRVTHPDQLTPGKLCALLTLEGGDALEGQLCNLRVLYALGARMLALTWSNDNELGCGCNAKEDRGLTRTGLEAVAEMNRLGMMVDVSHLSDQGLWQVLEASAAPPLASHSNARALCPGVARNLTDEMLAALGRKGGFVGVNAARLFLTGSQDRPATLEDMLRHLERMAALAGVEHVGLGTDFDGISSTPEGFEGCEKYQALPEALLRRNWPEAAVRGVCYQNLVDYWRRVLECRPAKGRA